MFPRKMESSIILVALALATTISVMSGYRTVAVPFDLAWQFSPIGLLQGVKPENLALESQSYFQGTLGLTSDYLRVFLKTCACEFPFYWLCFRPWKTPKVMAVLLGANLATHPLVFFVFPLFFEKYLPAALFSEAFAAFGEMAIAWVLLSARGTRMAKAAAWPAVLWILAANLFSWEVGMFV